MNFSDLRGLVTLPPIEPRQRLAGVTLIVAETVITYDAVASAWGLASTVGVDAIVLTVGSLVAWKLVKTNPLLVALLTLGLFVELVVGFGRLLLAVVLGREEDR